MTKKKLILFVLVNTTNTHEIHFILVPPLYDSYLKTSLSFALIWIESKAMSSNSKWITIVERKKQTQINWHNKIAPFFDKKKHLLQQKQMILPSSFQTVFNLVRTKWKCFPLILNEPKHNQDTSNKIKKTKSNSLFFLNMCI